MKKRLSEELTHFPSGPFKVRVDKFKGVLMAIDEIKYKRVDLHFVTLIGKKNRKKNEIQNSAQN